MSLNLDNKIVIITGATGGIGGEIAIDFLKEKSIVICLYRNEFKMGKFKSELAEKNIPIKNLHGYKCDLLNYVEICSVVKKVCNKFEKINVLINCAGFTKESPFALLNDTENSVGFYLEEKLYNSKFVNFHPLRNTATITMKCITFIEFMIENNKKIHIFSSAEEKIIKTYG